MDCSYQNLQHCFCCSWNLPCWWNHSRSPGYDRGSFVFRELASEQAIEQVSADSERNPFPICRQPFGDFHSLILFRFLQFDYFSHFRMNFTASATISAITISAMRACITFRCYRMNDRQGRLSIRQRPWFREQMSRHNANATDRFQP